MGGEERSHRGKEGTSPVPREEAKWSQLSEQACRLPKGVLAMTLDRNS